MSFIESDRIEAVDGDIRAGFACDRPVDRSIGIISRYSGYAALALACLAVVAGGVELF